MLIHKVQAIVSIIGNKYRVHFYKFLSWHKYCIDISSVDNIVYVHAHTCNSQIL